MFATSSFEFEGLMKVQPMAGIDEKLLHILAWTKLDFLNERRVRTDVWFSGPKESKIQVYYEFGIFNTIYGGEEMPNWITNRTMGPSISFRIPSSPNTFRGLNFCCVLTSQFFLEEGLGFVDNVPLNLQVIIISNITKKLTWIYHHYIDIVYLCGMYLMLSSHWMFGMNEMECGHQVTITVILGQKLYDIGSAVTKECGVNFVYDDGKEEEEEEYVLGYYKSWNHIIGGDLTGFQSTTEEYILNKIRIVLPYVDMDIPKYDSLCGEGACFKGLITANCLCGDNTDAFRKSTDGQWVHAFCAEAETQKHGVEEWNSLKKVRVPAKILQDAAHGKNYKSDQDSGARRLCDAIVLGGKKMAKDVYTSDVMEASDCMLDQMKVVLVSFFKKIPIFLLHCLLIQEEIYVARAPGRLDVVGGIVDYSGSLVLQGTINKPGINRALRADPEDVSLRHPCASIYVEPGNYHKAAESYEQIWQLCPKNLEPLKTATMVSTLYMFCVL
ncbi:unnamed protein product [Lactuca saligna]|uniref:C-JID domain-containing protein n=1 Tax=Lactuca saligna TaxID=75948 RepID=A0AA36E2T4_LACSI|nr:unnamed protein product [Lactuca saligna]